MPTHNIKSAHRGDVTIRYYVRPTLQHVILCFNYIISTCSGNLGNKLITNFNYTVDYYSKWSTNTKPLSVMIFTCYAHPSIAWCLTLALLCSYCKLLYVVKHLSTFLSFSKFNDNADTSLKLAILI